ncbi:MAG: cyclic nucleotide-binding domain-containing protein [Xenococcaceae cyanobacterium]
MPPLLQDMLRRVSYFENCTEEQLQELMEKGRRQVVQEKQILFRENEPGNSFYIILSGSVEIFSEQSNKILATRYNGEFFGEIAVLMGIPRTASVRALEDTTLFVVNRDGLQNLLSKYPQLAEKIAEELTKREEFLKSSGLLGDESDTEVTALLTKIRSRIQDIFSERRH